MEIDPLALRRVVAPLAALLLLCVTHADARFSPKDFAVRDAGTVHGLLLDEGVLLGGDDAPQFSCSGEFGAVASLLWTGRDAHAVALGSSGVWLTAEYGCHWRRTTGAVDGQRVVGHYQPFDGSDRVVFAVDDEFGGTAIMETVDGGFTSTLSGSLAVSDAAFVALAGAGEVVAIGSRTDEGMLRTWWSQDEGETFVMASDGEVAVSVALTAAGYAQGRLWLWDEGVLHGVNADGEIVYETPAVDTFGPVAGTEDGALWLAAGAEGLWRKGLEEPWERVQQEDTVHVKTAYGQLWVARSVAHAGAPVILRSDNAGASWWPVWHAPSTWTYPATCESSLAQTCGGPSTTLEQALSLPHEPASVDTTPPPEVTDEGGCGAARGPLAYAVIACLFMVLCLSSRRRRPGSP